MESLYEAYEYVTLGGWVMIPLGACSLAMWVLIAERMYTFRRLRQDDITIAQAIQAVREGTSAPASSGLHAQLVRAFLAERSGFADVDRHILRQCSNSQQARLNRFLSYIAVLASVAPILGLLGTVLGMISTFDVITMFGTGNAKAMAGGISVALITTQSGLLIAIPGLLLSGMLMRRSSRLKLELEETATVLDRTIKNAAARRMQQ